MNQHEIGALTCIHRSAEKDLFCLSCSARICVTCQMSPNHKGHKIQLLKLVEKTHEITIKELRAKIKQREEMRSEFQKDLQDSEMDSIEDIKSFSEKLIKKFTNLVKKRVQKLDKRLKWLKSQELGSFDKATLKMEKLLSQYDSTEKSDSMVTRRGYENYMITIDDTELWQHISALHHEVNIEFDPGNVKIPHKLVHFGFIGDHTYSADEDDDERYFSSDSEHRISIENLRKRKRFSDLDEDSSDESDLDDKNLKAANNKVKLGNTNGKRQGSNSKILQEFLKPSSSIQITKLGETTPKSKNNDVSGSIGKNLPNSANKSQNFNITILPNNGLPYLGSTINTPVKTLPKEKKINSEQSETIKIMSKAKPISSETFENGHNEVSSTNVEPMRVVEFDEGNHDKLENLVLKDLNSSMNLNAPGNDIQKYYELLKEKRMQELKESDSRTDSVRRSGPVTLICNKKEEVVKKIVEGPSRKRKSNIDLSITTVGAGSCLICEKNTQYRKSSVLLCCSSCSRFYHKNCYVPKLEYIPGSDWKCALCIKPEHYVEHLSKGSFIRSTNSTMGFSDAKICERILLELYALEESRPFFKVENYLAVSKISYSHLMKGDGKFLTFNTVRLNLSQYNNYASVQDFLSALMSIFLKSIELEPESVAGKNANLLIGKVNDLLKVFLPSYASNLSQ